MAILKPLISKLFSFRLLFLLGALYAQNSSFAQSPTTVQDQIFLGKQGDYAVFSQGSKKFFILIRAASSRSVWLEITEFPSLCYQDKQIVENSAWKTVLHKLSSQRQVFLIRISSEHSILAYSLDLKTNRWKKASLEQAPKLVSLLRLPLIEAPKEKIRMDNNNRPWSPKLSFEGTHTPCQVTRVYMSTWPKGDSLLSGKEVLMYFTSPDISVFPLWTSIDTPTGYVVLKNIDVGRNAESPFPLPFIDS